MRKRSYSALALATTLTLVMVASPATAAAQADETSDPCEDPCECDPFAPTAECCCGPNAHPVPFGDPGGYYCECDTGYYNPWGHGTCCDPITTDVCLDDPSIPGCTCLLDPDRWECVCLRDPSSAACLCGMDPDSLDCACATDPEQESCLCRDAASDSQLATSFEVCKPEHCGLLACDCCDNTAKEMVERALTVYRYCWSTAYDFASSACELAYWGRVPYPGTTQRLCGCVNEPGGRVNCSACLGCYMYGRGGTTVTLGGKVGSKLSAKLGKLFGAEFGGEITGSEGTSYPSFDGYNNACKALTDAILFDIAFERGACAAASCPYEVDPVPSDLEFTF